MIQSVSLISSGDSCLLQFGHKTLNFIVLNFEELFHFLYLEFQYFHCTLKFLNGIILLNQHFFRFLILRDFLELRLLSFRLWFVFWSIFFLFNESLYLVLSGLQNSFNNIRSASDNMIDVIFAYLIVEFFENLFCWYRDKLLFRVFQFASLALADEDPM